METTSFTLSFDDDVRAKVIFDFLSMLNQKCIENGGEGLVISFGKPEENDKTT